MHSTNPYMEKAFASLTSAVAELPVETILVANGGYRPDDAVKACFDRCISTAIGGLGYARNHGAEAANGEYISFFDADDLIERSYVTAILAAIRAGRLAGERYGYSATRNIGPSDEPLAPGLAARLTGEPNRALWYKHPFTGATLVIARENFIKVGGYKWAGYAEDYELSIRLRKQFGHATYLPDNHYLYRLHGNAMSSSLRNKARGVMLIQIHALLAGRGAAYAGGAVLNLLRLGAATVLRK